MSEYKIAVCDSCGKRKKIRKVSFEQRCPGCEIDISTKINAIRAKVVRKQKKAVKATKGRKK